MSKNTIKYFVIGTFVSLYLIVSIISTIHVVQFFDLTNPKWLSVSLAVAFEVGAAASLASLIALDKMNKFLVWVLFIVLTCMQAMGNTYYAYINIQDFSKWSELFGLFEEDLIFQKRMLSIISGAILPLVALGFIKSLVDYIKPEDQKEIGAGGEVQIDIIEELDNSKSFDSEDSVESPIDSISEEPEIKVEENIETENQDNSGISNSEETVVETQNNVSREPEMQKSNYNASLSFAQKRRPGLGM